MADYVIELAQLSLLLNPPLNDFLNLPIQHFPQEVRSALIVAKPTDFGEAVNLLKKLQGRKLSERNGEVNLGIYHPGRQSPQGGEGHSVVGREAGDSKATGTSPEVYSEQTNRSRKQNSNESENRSGPSGERGNPGEIMKIGEGHIETTKIISWIEMKAPTTASEADTRTGTTISEMAAVRRELTSSAPSITRTGAEEAGLIG